MLKNTDTQWGSLAKWFHWLVLILIAAQIWVGKVAEEAERGQAKVDLFIAHKSLGVMVFLLVLLRLSWRFLNPAPASPQDTPGWQRALANISHGLMYLLLLAVPITGWVVSDTSRIPFKLFWLIPMPDWVGVNRELHEIFEELHVAMIWTLVVVVVIHAAAALYHHFVKGNDVLKRMLPGG